MHLGGSFHDGLIHAAIVFEVPEASSIKDKRRVPTSVKEARLRNKSRASCAEVDLLDSLRFAHLGAARVSIFPQSSERKS